MRGIVIFTIVAVAGGGRGVDHQHSPEDARPRLVVRGGVYLVGLLRERQQLLHAVRRIILLLHDGDVRGYLRLQDSLPAPVLVVDDHRRPVEQSSGHGRSSEGAASDATEAVIERDAGGVGEETEGRLERLVEVRRRIGGGRYDVETEGREKEDEEKEGGGDGDDRRQGGGGSSPPPSGRERIAIERRADRRRRRRRHRSDGDCCGTRCPPR
mmetsp:Transcript_30871/g.92518  ORF Transcript_30871/g.92518 Transcript_30871/m.92518 type:complete len:212 (-) Transcript_30871:87-722(-)